MATQKKRVLVTGSEGVIGTLVREYLGERYDLVCLTWKPTDFSDLAASVTDLEAIAPAFEGVDTVVHLASFPSVSTTWEDILPNNIAGTYNVFEAARRAGVKRFVFASSNHAIGMYEIDGAPDIYAPDDKRVYDEHVALRPDSLYGVGKIFGESVGRLYHDMFGLEVVNLRIGTVRADDNPHSEATLTNIPEPLRRLTMDERRQRMSATWLSRRDCAHLIERAIEAPVDWAVVYGISNNPRQFWSLRTARELLGYDPQDRAPAS